MSLRELDVMIQRHRDMVERCYDLPAAVLWQLIAEIHRNRKTRQTPFLVEDFPLFAAQDEEDRQFPEEVDGRALFQRVAAWAQMMGADIRVRESDLTFDVGRSVIDNGS